MDARSDLGISPNNRYTYMHITVMLLESTYDALESISLFVIPTLYNRKIEIYSMYIYNNKIYINQIYKNEIYINDAYKNLLMGGHLYIVAQLPVLTSITFANR